MSSGNSELFLEVYSEEIPARLQRFAVKRLAQMAESELGALGLNNFIVSTECCPRRLVLHVQNLPEKLPQSFEEIRGPRTSAPAAALAGFMGKYGLSSVDQLEIRGEFYFYHKVNAERALNDVCCEVVEGLLKNFVWPKSMRWGQSGNDTWVRPIRSIICMFNNQILNLEYGGVHSSNYSFGHRLLGEKSKFEVLSYQDYLQELKGRDVILSFEERKQLILDYASNIASKQGVEFLLDEQLLEEVAGLTEMPNPMLGTIEARFMNLPFEVLFSTIKSHQKYLMFHNKQNRYELSPFFVIVADGKYDDKTPIIGGNERVLVARLSDAEFFYNNDLKVALSSKLELLKNRTFHSDIGSMYDKVQRMRKIGRRVCGYFGVDEFDTDAAILLCKCDLVSEMTLEFPDLQGIMGYYYARAEGVSEEIAFAIRDHYKPQGPSDVVPTNNIGAVVAVADKLDSLIELFRIGVKPTGNKDPFAQRRAAIGILRILDYYKAKLPMEKFVDDKSLLHFINERRSV